jgi:hypothetical protein
VLRENCAGIDERWRRVDSISASGSSVGCAGAEKPYESTTLIRALAPG